MSAVQRSACKSTGARMLFFDLHRLRILRNKHLGIGKILLVVLFAEGVLGSLGIGTRTPLRASMGERDMRLQLKIVMFEI